MWIIVGCIIIEKINASQLLLSYYERIEQGLFISKTGFSSFMENKRILGKYFNRNSVLGIEYLKKTFFKASARTLFRLTGERKKCDF